MAAESVALNILPALILGAILGLIEMVFVHSDEIGMNWFMHGLHALPFTMLFVFVNMNVTWVLNFINSGLLSNFWVVFGVRAVVAIVAMVKIQAAAAIANRVGERIHHTIIIGLLILAVPYLWDAIGHLIPMPTLF